MANHTVAIIVTDANKVAVAAALSALTPHKTVGFIRPCCAADTVAPTWETPATHWYSSPFAPLDDVVLWQAAVDAAALDPLDPLHGLFFSAAQNVTNPVQWAQTHLADKGLMFVPDEE